MFFPHTIPVLKPSLEYGGKFLEPDKSVPNGHKGNPKEEAEGAPHLSDHGGRVVQQLFFLNRGVPGWGVCT